MDHVWSFGREVRERGKFFCLSFFFFIVMPNYRRFWLNSSLSLWFRDQAAYRTFFGLVFFLARLLVSGITAGGVRRVVDRYHAKRNVCTICILNMFMLLCLLCTPEDVYKSGVTRMVVLLALCYG